MPIRLLLLLVFSCFAYLGRSQNVYCVRAGATGDNNGSDWNNAYTSLPATLRRGAIYYVADGTYPSYTFDDPVSGTNVITIKKATVADHGTNAGWLDSYGDGQAVFNSTLRFTTANWIFDGQTRNEGNWFDGAAYGFRIAHNGQDQQISADSTSVDNVQIRYVFFDALDTPLPSSTIARYALNLYDSSWTGRFTGWVIHRCFFFHGNVHIFVRTSDGLLCEYSAFADNQNNDANHATACSGYFENENAIFRYNKFRAITGTAVLAFIGRGWQIYGNVCWDCVVGDASFGFDGTGRTGYDSFDCKVYNNTIVDSGFGNTGVHFGYGTGNLVYNNLWVNSGNVAIAAATHDYNAFSTSDNHGESHAQINVPTAIFVNYAADDFRLASATAAGSSLGAPYNVDMLGRIRGADGTWDRGAYEYGPVSTNPVIVIYPSVLDFGSIPTNTARELSFTVQNAGGGTLVGTATVAAPFSIVSGAAYSLGANQSQSVTVRYSPVSAGNHLQTVTFTGGGGATAKVTGMADSAIPAVALTAPLHGLTVSNLVNLAATATDDVGVAGVIFFVNGKQVFDDTASPYSYLWDSRWVTNGSYKVCAQVRDVAGKTAWSGTNVIVVSNAPGALPSPLVYWSFDEGTGSTSTDRVSTNVLTLRNGATWTSAGKFGPGVLLDGVNDYADAPNSPELGMKGDAMSVAAWVKIQPQSAWPQLVAKVKETGSFTPPYFSWHLFGFNVSTNQWRPQFQLATTNNTDMGVNVSSAINVNYGEWVHLVGVYDGAAVRIYVNGVEQGSATQSGPILDYDQPLYIGAHGLPDEFAKGVIDEVRIYAGALSATQVQALYNYSPGRPSPPLALHVVGGS